MAKSIGDPQGIPRKSSSVFEVRGIISRFQSISLYLFMGEEKGMVVNMAGY